MEVRELHDDAAVEACRQAVGGVGEGLGLEGVVAPPEEDGGKGAQQEEFQKQMPPAAAGPCAVGLRHGGGLLFYGTLGIL